MYTRSSPIYSITGVIAIILISGCVSSVQNNWNLRPSFDHNTSIKPSKKVIFSNTPHSFKGTASYYSDKFQGRKTASGERYDRNALTAAHRTLPFNTMVEVENLDNGKCVIVRINDRGPHKKNRIIDLSYEAAKRIDLVEKGMCMVSVRVVK